VLPGVPLAAVSEWRASGLARAKLAVFASSMCASTNTPSSNLARECEPVLCAIVRRATLAAMLPRHPNYARRLARVIVLDDGTAIVTLLDAVRIVRDVELAIEQLTVAAKSGDDADIAEATDTLERVLRARPAAMSVRSAVILWLVLMVALALSAAFLA